MDAMRSLEVRFGPVLQDFLASRTISAMLNRTLTVPQYRSMMREVFHHTRENPQMQALATTYFRGKERRLVRDFFKHAASEIGHDELAFSDFVTLGGDPAPLPYENPLPATMGLLAYGFHQIVHKNHLGYLGYLYFLEFMPTSSGGEALKALADIGVPAGATRFLVDHTQVDIGHNKMMEKYASLMINDEADLDCVAYAMKTTGHLYAGMMDAAAADALRPSERGWNWEELRADGLTPADVQARIGKVAAA